MGTVRRISLSLMIFLFFLIFILQFASADVLRIEGEMSSNATAYIKRWFSSYQGTKNLTYRMYFPQNFSEGLNTQSITKLRKTFTPYPNDVHEFTDEFGNTGVELIWNKEIRIVQLDLQFTAKTFSNYASINSDAPFPITVGDEQNIFLTSTDLSPNNDFYINYIGRSLTNNANREIDAVNNIFLWVDRNIKLSTRTEEEDQYNALSVLKKREGDEKGICNLATAILKGVGIPARVVYGISFQKEINIEVEERNFIYDLPNGERYWVEVFFPDLGWISYDPHGMHFGLIPHVIKLSVGPDTDFVTEAWGVELGEAEIQKEFIYDIQFDDSVIQFKDIGSGDINKLVLSPYLTDIIIYDREPNLDIEGLILETVRQEPEVGIDGIILYNSNVSNSLNIDATIKRVHAQKFSIPYPVKILEMRLPLLKFGDEGRIWVDIYENNNGVPGKLLFKTYSVNSSKIRFMMIENPWLSFPIGQKTNTSLSAGSYWFALRSSGNCIFNWYASEGNVIGEENDTVYRIVGTKKLNWNNVLNCDMNFQLIGIREEEI